MTKKISYYVVTAAAVALVLSGCGRGLAPDMDDMDMAPSLDGEWHFASHRFVAMIDGMSVMVTVGDGMTPLVTTNPTYAVVTQIVAKGNLALEGTAYKLTLAEGDDAIEIMLSSALPPGIDPAIATVVAKTTVRTLIEDAQNGDVMITVDEDADPATMTVMGSFLDSLLNELGMQVPEGGLVGCKGAPCMMAP